MEKQTFKEGDWVVRLQGGHRNMRIGQIDEIVSIDGAGINLKKYGEGHDDEMFRLAEQHEIPIEHRKEQELIFQLF